MQSPEAYHTINSWCADKPGLAAYFCSLNENDIAWGVFSNAAKQLLTHPSQTNINDLDILVAEEQFKDIAELTPDAEIRSHSIEIVSADGAQLAYPADELSATIDGVPIQIMRSPQGIDRDGSHQYRLDMTELAAENRTYVPVQGADIAFAHPFDTVAAKAILQRTAPKQDLADAQQLIKWGRLYDPAHEPYVRQRLEEIRLDIRGYRFLGSAGLRQAMELVA